MKTPFNLDKGIYFEDSGSTLLWADDFESIREIDNPEISGNGYILKWRNKICLGGQKLNVSVIRNDYNNYNNKLESVEFEEQNGEPWKTYEKYSRLMKEYFGNPNEYKDDGYGRPTELWNINDVQIIIGVGERFTEFEIFSIRKGKRFWKLTNENNERTTAVLSKWGFWAKLKQLFVYLTEFKNLN